MPPIRSVLAALVLAVVPGAALSQSEPRCQIVKVSGAAVTLERGSQRVRALVGQVLATGDRIVTAADARAAILCDDGLTMNVGPGTRIELDALTAPSGRGVSLLEGIAGFLLRRQRSDGFEVRTPSAVAAVRSTEWAMEVAEGATATFVREGQVEVTASNEGALLGPGEGVDVSIGGLIGEVESWSEERVAGFGVRLGPDWQARAR